MANLKFILIFFLIFSYCAVLGQETTLSEFQKTVEQKAIRTQKWEEQLQWARENGDLYTEMLVLRDLIYFKVNDYGDNITTYRDLLYLDNLVKENPNFRAVKHVEAPLNMFMGCSLRDQNRLEESIPYFENAVAAAKKYKLSEYYKDASCHLAEALGRVGKGEEALQLFRKLEKEAQETQNDTLLTRTYEVLSSFYSNEKKLDSSLYYAQKSIDDNAPNNQQACRLSKVAENYLLMRKELDSSIYYASKALEISEESHLEKEKMIAHEQLWRAYERKNEPVKAYYHLKRFVELEREQKSFNIALQIGNLSISKEREEARLQKELDEEKLSNQESIIWLVSGGLLLLTVGGGFTLNRLIFIRKQNKIIAKEKERAEQSEKYKEQFLANMSHEIRTPMHAISGITNTLLRNNHSKSQDVYLEAMKTSSDNLLILLDDILDLSKIDSGELEIENIIYNPHSIIQNVEKALKFRASDKGLTLVSQINPDVPEYIIGDPARLYQVLTNLVGNAIKFTESGGITIILSTNNVASNTSLRCCVQDTGIGISESKIDYIFETFKQGEKSKSQIFKGTGLGLSISKKLIELQNGKIWVESQLGKGSKFFFELPLIVSDEVKNNKIILSNEDLIETGKKLKGIKILLAEDDDFNIMVLEDDLKYYINDFDLTIARNGEEAVKALIENEFDIILMDMHMPIMGGIEATKKIRKMEVDKGLKKSIIIAMTANIVKSEIERCLAAGMNDYIPKPYKPETILGKLSIYFTKTVL